jgi:hypothetical protein
MQALWGQTVRLLRRIKLFLLPAPGWRKRIHKYKAGQTSWQIPGAPPDSPASIGPWPIEWTPCAVTPVLNDEGVMTGAKLEFFDFHSDVSGRWAEGEEAVACARCGVRMHVADTEMETNLDVPLCPWCVRVAG